MCAKLIEICKAFDFCGRATFLCCAISQNGDTKSKMNERETQSCVITKYIHDPYWFQDISIYEFRKRS